MLESCANRAGGAGRHTRGVALSAVRFQPPAGESRHRDNPARWRAAPPRWVGVFVRTADRSRRNASTFGSRPSSVLSCDTGYRTKFECTTLFGARALLGVGPHVRFPQIIAFLGEMGLQESHLK